MTAWDPMTLLEQAWIDESLFIVRRHILANWYSGLVFGVCLTVILGAHELGHYFATRLYRIRSTLPLFIPFPISPTGTCGAVIMMDGAQADRKQIFDIGIAGPLTGLVFAIPIAAFGLLADSAPMTTGSSIQFGLPLAIQWLDIWLHDSSALGSTGMANSSMNPMLMAAWVGLLVTGVNMVPISQLDGGHVLHGLLGQDSRIVSWLTYFACLAFVIYSGYRYGQPVFVLMLLLIPFMGIAHPPSRDDRVSLGTGRQLLGWLSLWIPLVCIPLRPIMILS
jgi:membrane-associated protease RseP (regulator of RpoE activity)